MTLSIKLDPDVKRQLEEIAKQQNTSLNRLVLRYISQGIQADTGEPDRLAAPVESETIFDTVSDRYQLVNVGWKDASTRIYGCVLHVDIKDGKIWVQHDGTEDAIADQLVALGVPKQDSD